MICIIALVVFGVLGIFSAKYRIIAKEAFDCVFRRITLRKCESGLDKRLKSQITGNLMKRSPKIARLTYKNFEILSWFFTILMIASIVQSGISVYNYVQYGNCNGPTNEGFCVFDPLKKEEVSSCHTPDAVKKELSAPSDVSQFDSFGKKGSSVKFIMFGCYTCPYTKKAMPVVFDIYEEYKDRVEFVFIDFPIPTHQNSFLAGEAAQCAYEQNKDEFIEYSKNLYANQNVTYESIIESAKKINGINVTEFESCINNHKYESFINQSLAKGNEVGVYGTPTFFINKQPVVGPNTKKAFEKLLNDALNE